MTGTFVESKHHFSGLQDVKTILKKEQSKRLAFHYCKTYHKTVLKAVNKKLVLKANLWQGVQDHWD